MKVVLDILDFAAMFWRDMPECLCKGRHRLGAILIFPKHMK